MNERPSAGGSDRDGARPGSAGPAAPGEPPAARRALPLGARIAVAVLVAFVAALAAGGIFLRARVARLADDDLRQALWSDLDMLEAPVRSALAARDHDALAAIAAGAARRSVVRVSAILPDGTVVAESEHRLPVPSHADRPEVVAALRDGFGSTERASTTTGDRYVYFARRIDDADGRALGVLRLARSHRAAQAVDAQIWRALGAGSLVGLAVAALVGWFAARRIATPLEEMTAAAGRMAAGEFTPFPLPARRDEAGRLAAALHRMGVELSAMLSLREAQRAEIDAILGSMAEGVLAVDRDECVLLANKAVAECLRLPARPEVGTPLREVVRLPEISTRLRSALAGERSADVDVVLPGAAGRVLAIGAAPIRDADDTVRGVVLVLRDVTVMRRLERTRLDFVANVSHELRTPLAAVLGALETARDLGETEAEARARMLDTAMRHGRRLSDIVDDLLALSQIESEGDRLERVPVPLLRTLRSAASAVAGQARARGVTLTLPGADFPDVAVRGHEGRLEQVWTNLLSNAVKYNRAGGSVTVAVSVVAPARVAEVTVRDTGQGISAEHLPRIFERFYRVDRGRSREQGGTGLGLAIVKHIVVAHRGSIDVESVPGEGSAFRVRIPLAAAPTGA